MKTEANTTIGHATLKSMKKKNTSYYCLYFAIKLTDFESWDFGISPGAPNLGNLHAQKARISKYYNFNFK